MKLTKRKFCINNNFEPQLIDTLCHKGIIPFEVEQHGLKTRVMIDDSVASKLVESVHFVSCPGCGKKMASVTEKHLKVCKLISRRINSDPNFIERKRMVSKQVNSDPRIRKSKSISSRKMWESAEFRKKNEQYVKENIDKLKISAQNAREYLNKKSKIHIAYKKRMIESGLDGFISEYPYGPYSIDEADPIAKIAIEIDGCYWHGCPQCNFVGDDRIKSIDKRKTTYLYNRGWVIFRIKEHEIKENPYIKIGAIKTLQERRRKVNLDKIRSSFLNNKLCIKSVEKTDVVWKPIKDVLRHHTPHKKMFKVVTDIGSVTVTEDHSLFSWADKSPVNASGLKVNDLIVGECGNDIKPVRVIAVTEDAPQKYTYDVSVPSTESALTDSGILVHNSYSISGVSLDIEKSSKYEAIKDQYIAEYDKLVEANKRSIKIVVGLRQFRYGVGITSALGPLNTVGAQSRRNYISPMRPIWV